MKGFSSLSVGSYLQQFVENVLSTYKDYMG